MKLSGIYIYPVKSLGGIRILSSDYDEKGLLYDRRWMIIDENNKFISQRTKPEMSYLKVHKEDKYFVIEDSRYDKEALLLPLKLKSNDKLKVNIWNDQTQGYFYDDESTGWISDSLRGKYRFVYMPDEERRPVEGSSHIVSYADAYPFLIIGEEGLTDLSQRVGIKLNMMRFRPNLVFSGGEPYEEDTWEEFKIGSFTFNGVKPCSRCSITTIDPVSFQQGDEPLRTLSEFRKYQGKTYFGMNITAESKTGLITVGDPVRVLKRKVSLQFENK